MKEYYIGIDGGGTNSTVLVSDGQQDITCFQTGGFNYNSFSKDKLAENIKQISSRLGKMHLAKEDCKGICLGSAGISNQEAEEFFRLSFSKEGFQGRILLTGDEVIAYNGAFHGESGILLISGTGSICYGRSPADARLYRAGGYGHLIDDEGSGYALGRDLLHEVVQEGDGRKPRSILTDLVFEYLKISSLRELVTYVYDQSHSKKEIAAVASLFSDARIKNSETAERIIEKAAEELVLLVAAVYASMKNQISMEIKIPLVLTGSVLSRNTMLRSVFLEKIKRRFPELQIMSAKQEEAVA